MSRFGLTLCALYCVAVVALAGCFGSTQAVEVRIARDGYQVGNIKSALATPAVDEVVRVNPKRVVMMICFGTPPAKGIQFEREFSARSKADLKVGFTDEGCPA
jgi:hypothetical protein